MELRNGLRGVSREVDEGESRDQRLAVRELRERVEREVLAPSGAGGWPGSGPRTVLWIIGSRCRCHPCGHWSAGMICHLSRCLSMWSSAAVRPGWCWLLRRLSGCCSGRKAG